MQPDKSLNELLNRAREYQVNEILQNIEALQNLKNLNLSHYQLEKPLINVTKLKSLKFLNKKTCLFLAIFLLVRARGLMIV